MADLPQFSVSDLTKLDVSSDEQPDSQPAVETFAHLRHTLTEALSDTAWGNRYIWEKNFTTPYLGPNEPQKSTYIWLGLIDKHYQDRSRASNALQIEFGLDTGSATGFLAQDVLWGILLGPWADDDVIKTAKKQLGKHSALLTQFLADNDEYVLLTKTSRLDQPSTKDIKSITAEIDTGFAITRDLDLTDLPGLNIHQAAIETLSELTHIYRLLAEITDAPSVTPLSSSSEDTDYSTKSGARNFGTDSLAAATTLDHEDIEDTVSRLKESGCSQREALEYVQRYLTEMLRGDGLFAVRGIGPNTGRALVDAGITTIADLQSVTPNELTEQSDLSLDQIQRFQNAAEKSNFSSLDPDDEQVATQLLSTSHTHTSTNTRIEAPSSKRGRSDTESNSKTESGTHGQNPSQQSSPRDKLQDALAPEELPVPAQEEYTVPGGGTVYPNYLSEYYEAFRSARTVLELVFQIPNVDINPDNRRDPRVQYFILLDACIGFGDISTPFTGYGPQHRDRLPFSIEDYRKVFGNAETVTDYQVINTKPFGEDTHEILREKTSVKSRQEFVRPCIPGTGIPLLELPGTFEELQDAIQRLATFPAYPPLPPESGKNAQPIPITDIYQMCVEGLSPDYQADLSPLTTVENQQPTGPVPAATPTSTAEAESTLLDYGRLSHLFKRINPPADSPTDRVLNVFALDWYRSNTPNFNGLQALAKHGEDDSVSTFRPRLQDLIHRRFLLDTWDYDYITVFPSHEAHSLNPQLVNLAQDSVVETKIIYTPLLERTETVERQRQKSKEERQQIAANPSRSLRTRAKLNDDTVILLDDICTTGSSLIAGSHLLRQAGADRVVCITLGLTPGGSQADVKEITDPEAPASTIIAGLES